jgi:hypothetical protein
MRVCWCLRPADDLFVSVLSATVPNQQHDRGFCPHSAGQLLCGKESPNVFPHDLRGVTLLTPAAGLCVRQCQLIAHDLHRLTNTNKQNPDTLHKSHQNPSRFEATGADPAVLRKEEHPGLCKSRLQVPSGPPAALLTTQHAQQENPTLLSSEKRSAQGCASHVRNQPLLSIQQSVRVPSPGAPSCPVPSRRDSSNTRRHFTTSRRNHPSSPTPQQAASSAQP